MSNAEVDDVIEEGFQHALAMAGQIGSAAARVWKHHQDQARTDATRQGAVDRLAFESERVAATTALAPTSKEKWWDGAGSKDIVDAYRIATAWKDQDPAAAAAEANIRAQVKERYNVEIDAVATGEKTITAGQSQDNAQGIDRTQSNEATKDAEGFAAVARAEYARADIASAEADQERTEAPTHMEEEWYRDQFLTRDPDAESAEVRADRDDAVGEVHEKAGDAATVKSQRAYGTAEHRAALEERLVTAGAPAQGIKARMQGERIQKHPIAHAAAGKGAKAGKTRGASTQTQAQAKNRSQGR